MSVLLLKITTFFVNIGSLLGYNFHKHFKNIKTKKNVNYGKKSIYRKFDVHYHKSDLKRAHKQRPIVVYFHGGGWSAYSKSIFTTLCRRFANMGYVVFNVNYRLAPKAKMEGILADCVNALNEIKTIAGFYNGDSSKIVLAGDSAGAHIASFIATSLTSQSFDLNAIDKIKSNEKDYYKQQLGEARKGLKNAIKGLVLFYGVYNLTTMLKSGFPNIKTYAKASLYGAGKDKKENNIFSPISYIDEKFPPSFIASGEIDKLHDSQSVVLKHVLEDRQVKLQNVFFSKEELRAMHAYMIFDGLYTNEKTLKEVQKFLKEVI